jgi:CheY-like chemotaxis protein
MSCKPILVVEDDEDIRTQVIAALEAEGYYVNSAENGRAALAYLLSLPEGELPGCIILDLMMPEMDGHKLMNTIEKEHPRLHGIKILVATAKGSSGNPESVPQALERLQKPFELEELYRMVEQHCGKP